MKILLFGSLREDIGVDVSEDLPSEGCSIATLRRLLVAKSDSYAPLARPSVRASVDQVLVPDDYVIRPGQEVAFFPVFSGG
jgi:molybdopterin synthase sulfur carrier subunit